MHLMPLGSGVYGEYEEVYRGPLRSNLEISLRRSPDVLSYFLGSKLRNEGETGIHGV